jgi:glutathione S-transferase
MLTLHHAPQSRSFAVLWLLEELGVDYAIEPVDIRGGGVPQAYREIQPHGKVPAIVHDGIVVCERAAICQYLTEVFPGAGLAPVPGDPSRAPFLQMLAYADAVVDPCLAARAAGLEYAPADFSFGSFDDMLAHLRRTLSARTYAAGERFSAADTQIGTALFWGVELLKLVPDEPVLRDYLDRLTSRPGWQRAERRDASPAPA